jgi:nitrogenase subunit NifH
MIKKIKKHLVIMISLLTMVMPVALPSAISYASCPGVAGQVETGATAANNNTDVGCDPSGATSNTTNSIQTIATTVTNWLSIIVGAASIIMIIYAGFRYITSGGSSERIGSAKTTLIYAIIGLIVVAAAQLIVRFVLSQTLNTGGQLTQ